MVSYHFPFIEPRPQNSGDYVCTPCGSACDVADHPGPGKCENCGMALVKKSEIKFTNITLDQLCQRLQANPNAVLLDVRSPGEFKGTTSEVPTFGHFKNAININIVELESKLGTLAQYKNREILVYCSHSHRSPRASYILGLNGFNNVKNLAGGVSTFQQGQACLKKDFIFHTK